MAESEVARLMKQIEQECEASKRGLYGFATVARHDFINAKYSNLGTIQRKLAEHVGEDEATKLLYEAYVKIIG